MSEDIEEDAIAHPRATTVLFGHAEAERALLESYKSGRIPHAWLIGGPPGIGKATLAFRMARFVLAHPDPAAPAVQKAATLAVDANDPVARRVAAQAHGDLLLLERTLNEKGNLRQDIAVDDVRRCIPFFGSTASEGGWRIVIVDVVDDLNSFGANALLKILEEPPPHSLLLLVSHAPGRVLPTLRSRCRRLLLRPLDADDVARAVAAASGRSPSDPELKQAAVAGEGSVARALSLFDEDGLALRQRVLDLLAQLPDPDPRALHALGDALGGSEPETLTTFVDVVNGWLSGRLADGAQDTQRLARIAAAWDTVNEAARAVEIYNLERKPLVFAVFGALAEASRG